MWYVRSDVSSMYGQASDRLQDSRCRSETEITHALYCEIASAYVHEPRPAARRSTLSLSDMTLVTPHRESVML